MQIEPIAIVRSPYKQRFGIPRQPGLVDARGTIEMLPKYNDPAMLDGLGDFSHIWVSFLFHGNIDQGWKKKVKPPRLGGKKQVGVFASRSPHRPNFIGLSALRLLKVKTTQPPQLLVSGIDLLDATPVIDIKPYVAYSDSIEDATCGYAQAVPPLSQQVIFTDAAQAVMASRPDKDYELKLIHDVLAQDPRPPYKSSRTTERNFGMRLGDFEIQWQVENNTTFVVAINLADDI